MAIRLVEQLRRNAVALISLMSPSAQPRLQHLAQRGSQRVAAPEILHKPGELPDSQRPCEGVAGCHAQPDPGTAALTDKRVNSRSARNALFNQSRRRAVFPPFRVFLQLAPVV
jgi:hypothetical protein